MFVQEEEAERLRGLPLLSSALGIATVIGSKVLSGVSCDDTMSFQEFNFDDMLMW